MENKVQISIRLNPEIIRAAEKAIAGRSYWKRSDFINHVLMAVIYNFNEAQIYDMMRWNPWNKKRIECEFQELTVEMSYEEHMTRRKMWDKK